MSRVLVVRCAAAAVELHPSSQADPLRRRMLPRLPKASWPKVHGAEVGRVRIRRERDLHLKYMSFVLHSENDNHLWIGRSRTETGKIAIAIKDNTIKPPLQIPAIPLLDASIVIGFSVGNRCPAIIASTGQTSMHSDGRFPVRAVQNLRENSHFRNTCLLQWRHADSCEQPCACERTRTPLLPRRPGSSAGVMRLTTALPSPLSTDLPQPITGRKPTAIR